MRFCLRRASSGLCNCYPLEGEDHAADYEYCHGRDRPHDLAVLLDQPSDLSGGMCFWMFETDRLEDLRELGRIVIDWHMPGSRTDGLITIYDTYIE